MVFLIPVLAALLSAIVAVLVFDRAAAAHATGGVTQGFLLSIVAGFGLVLLVVSSGRSPPDVFGHGLPK